MACRHYSFDRPTAQNAMVFVVIGSSGFVGRSIKAQLTQSVVPSFFPHWRVAEDVLYDVVRLHPEAQILVLDLTWPSVNTIDATQLSSPQNSWFAYTQWLLSLFQFIKRHTTICYFGVGTGIEPYANASPPVLDEPYRTYAARKLWVCNLASAELGERAHRRRLHFLFGPHERSSRFVPTALTACRRGTSITLNEPTRRRHWLHVTDAAAGLLASMDPALPRICDVTGVEMIAFDVLCGLIEQQVGQPLERRQTGTTADVRCMSIQSERIAPVLPADIGSPLQIARRLKEYDAWLQSQRSLQYDS